jgi:glyoxylase-like metal-dependent hydrolase (beta-lactamase superfamily II)
LSFWQGQYWPRALETFSDLLIKAVEEHTQAPVDFVINTHVHGDHIGGNAALKNSGATIISHDNIRHRMLADNEAKDALPEVTFSDSVTFHLNGHTAFVFHVPHAHTDGDAAIHFSDVNIIHSGDLLFNGLFRPAKPICRLLMICWSTHWHA